MYKLLFETKKVRSAAKLPARSTAGAAGYDLHACIETPLRLLPGDAQLVPTGIAIHLENPNYAAVILPRSGLGHKRGLVLGNLVGLIDSDYQGEIMVSAWNRHLVEEIVIHPGDRIAQLVFLPVTIPTLIEVDEFSDATERATGGFGSTGVQA